MRSFRAASAALLAVSVLLAGGAALPSYADPHRPHSPRPGLPGQASDRAEEALQLAQDVITGVDESVEPTIALRDLFAVRGDLKGEDRDRADRLLARPDGQSPGWDFENDPTWGVAWSPASEARPVCNARICVHYVTFGEHAATYGQAKATLANVTRSWRVEVGSLRFRAPRRDGTRGDRRWSDSKGKLDVYLADLGNKGIFGYAAPEEEPAATDDGRAATVTGYMVLDQDFAEFDCPSPADCRRVTAAHELFHLVQYAYHFQQHRWFMEATATWMEERVFDGVNDNRRYLPSGQLGNPDDPITTLNGNAPYGNWLLFEFISQRSGSKVVRQAWYFSSRDGRTWRQGLWEALKRNGTTWPKLYAAFAANNLFPGRTYEEGGAYPAAPRTDVGPNSSDTRQLDPHTSRSYKFTPRTGLFASGSRLRLDIDMAPGITQRAYVIVNRTNGRLSRLLVPLDAQGDGTRWLPFEPDEVRAVTLTLVNSSTGTAGARYTASS